MILWLESFSLKSDWFRWLIVISLVTGKIAEALVANAPTLIAGTPQINKVQVLASKVQKADVKLGLRVLAAAKADKVEDVKQFLIVSSISVFPFPEY